MRQLIPAEAGGTGRVELVDAYAYPSDAARWLRASMIATVDGGTDVRGVSGPLSSRVDRSVLATLRGLSDAVLVGAGTARAEGYGPAVVNPAFARIRAAAGQHPAPPIAVVSRHLDLDLDAALFAETKVPTVIVTCAGAPADRLAAARLRCGDNVVIAGTHQVDLPLALDMLAARGYRRLLCEGGPRLLTAVVQAGRLDELCVTISPQLISGDSSRLVSGVALPTPRPLHLHQLLVDDGYLFARYLVMSR